MCIVVNKKNCQHGGLKKVTHTFFRTYFNICKARYYLLGLASCWFLIGGYTNRKMQNSKDFKMIEKGSKIIQFTVI